MNAIQLAPHNTIQTTHLDIQIYVFNLCLGLVVVVTVLSCLNFHLARGVCGIFGGPGLLKRHGSQALKLPTSFANNWLDGAEV